MKSNNVILNAVKDPFLVIVVLIAIYLIYPVPGFPPHPPGSFYSTEPADTENIFRKAYYTNLSRAEITNFYKSQWKWPFIRLDHPREFAYELIRDQTQSQWLEELVHPGKDSVFINGYYPTRPNEQFNYNGTHYTGKITVRYVPSHPATRLTVLILTSICIYLLYREYAR